MRLKKPRLRAILGAIVLLAATDSVFAASLVVSAASSLTNAYKEVAQAYEAQYPKARVDLNFGASGVLLQQMAKGAPVDVFASADQETMDMAERQGLISAGSRHDFVRNALVLIRPVGSTLAVSRLDDLSQAHIRRVAIGNPASVPAGRYTRQALEKAALWPVVEAKAIHTQNVRQSLDYVARGEVDAGFVYATDAAIMADKVEVVMEVPLDSAISYPIAVTANTSHGEAAARFVEFVLSPVGQEILAKYDFRRL